MEDCVNRREEEMRSRSEIKRKEKTSNIQHHEYKRKERHIRKRIPMNRPDSVPRGVNEMGGKDRVFGMVSGLLRIENRNNAKRREEFQTICPVCGRRISGKNLPTQESIITDEIFSNLEPDRIISSKVLIRHVFSHFYDEEKDCTMDDPHDLLSIIQAEFDGDGECIAFSLVKVYPTPQGEGE